MSDNRVGGEGRFFVLEDNDDIVVPNMSLTVNLQIQWIEYDISRNYKNLLGVFSERQKRRDVEHDLDSPVRAHYALRTRQIH